MARTREKADKNSVDRVMVREHIEAIGKPIVVKALAPVWDNSTDDTKTILSNYFSGERTINATKFVQLLEVVFRLRFEMEKRVAMKLGEMDVVAKKEPARPAIAVA